MKVFICACAVVFFICGAKELQTTAETKPRLTKTECIGKECQVGKNVGLTLLMHDVSEQKSEVVETESEELPEATLGEEAALEEEDDTPPPPPPPPPSMVQATDNAGDNTDQEFTSDGDTPPPPPPPQKDSMVQASSDGRFFPGMFGPRPSPGSATPRPTPHPTTADSAKGMWIGLCYKFCRPDMVKFGEWEVVRDTDVWSWGYQCQHATKHDYKNVWFRSPATRGCVRGSITPHLKCSNIPKRRVVLCTMGR